MKSQDFSKFLSSNIPERLFVLDKSIPHTKYVPLDLSASNKNLNKLDVSSSNKLGNYINNYIQKNNAQVAFGGYLEVRNIYKRSHYFNKQASEERNIHIGVDLWCDEETPIYTPLDGTVHSFKNNKFGFHSKFRSWETF